MRALQPIPFIVRKEFLQLFRDPALLRIVVFVPLIQLFIFGYAANTDLENVRVALLDQDRSRESRALADAFFAADVYVPGPVAESPRDLQRFLVQGEAELSLWIPRGYAEAWAAGEAMQVGVQVDGSNSSLAGRAAAYAGVIVSQSASASRSAPGPRGRFLYNPELRSRFYMVPGIVVLVVTIISALLTGMAVVREREIGTLEQLMVSPLTPGQLIAGKTIPFAILAFLDLAFATLVAVLWFRLPFEGSILLLAGGAGAYLLVTLGLGLLASTISTTQQQAMFTLWFFLVFAILMSGFFYPIDNMPPSIRWLAYANPLRYMMTIVRGIFLRGATLADLAPSFAILLAMGGLIFSAAVWRFRKRAQ
ncbi:MAG: ABC transporter permease [Candidatus Eisenbacteria bacterium]